MDNVLLLVVGFIDTMLTLDIVCSCLKVILDNMEKLSKPEINALLYEFGFQVNEYLLFLNQI